MTINEILKAIECCTRFEPFCPSNCPMLRTRKCRTQLLKKSFHIIKNLKAEIERLTNIVDDGAEVCHNCHSKYAEKIKQAKAEAIKEFAERLTDKADLIRVNAFDSKWAISQDDIDNLVEEMVGNSND